MIYIEHEEGKVVFIHYRPLDKQNGLGKTVIELKKEGLIVDSIPECVIIEGKQAIMYVNPTTKEIYYEYEDILQTEDDIIKQTVNSLGQSLAEEKIKNMQKDTVITQLGGEISKIKLDIMKMKGSAV